MSAASWRATLRLSRREAWRHKGRSLLVLALIGLPVLALSAVAVLYRTWQLDPTTSLDRSIGHADALVNWYPYPNLRQDTAGGMVFGGGMSATASGGRPTTASVAALMPPGSRIIEYRTAAAPVTFAAPRGIEQASFVGLNYTDPLARGIVHQVSGRAPRSVDEVAISAAVADHGLGVGDVVHALDPSRTFTVVGIVEPSAKTNEAVVYALPAAVHIAEPITTADDGPTHGWLIGSTHPVSWDRVRAGNATGFVTISRAVLADPPPASEQGVQTYSSSGRIDAADSTAAALVGALAALEIVLLAGPAFAISARRRRRELALLAVVGGSRHDLRRIVLADALVLGVLSGVLAAGAGVGLAALLVPQLDRINGDLPGTFTVPWLQVVGLAAIAVVTALAAALVPARAAGRTDVVAELGGRRGSPHTSHRLPIAGALVAVLGAVLALLDLGPRSRSLTVVGGVTLMEIGLIMATPWVIAVAATAARRLPLPGRIALRDAARNRSAATPAVAAVMAVVMGATAVAVAAQSRIGNDERDYLASLPARDTYVALSGQSARTDHNLGIARRAAARAFTDSTSVALSGVVGLCSDDGLPEIGSCTSLVLGGQFDISESQFQPATLPVVLVDGGNAADAALGADVPAARSALRAGRIVVPDARGIRDGRVTLRAAVRTTTGDLNAHEGAAQSVTVAATVVPRAYLPGIDVILPPAVAQRLHLDVRPAGVLVESGTSASEAQLATLSHGLTGVDGAITVHAEAGPHSDSSWIPAALFGVAGLIALLASLIATALLGSEGSRDLAVLGAIGATPRTRRAIAFARAGLIAGIGAIAGAIAGLVPAQAWADNVQAPLAIPWLLIVVTALGIPLLAASVAGLSTRGRLPSGRAA